MYSEIAGALQARGVEFIVLKGFSHWPHFSADPRQRPQYDLDLLCQRVCLMQAKNALVELGYEPLSGFDKFPLDHLPAMIRKTGWQWKGDFFDVEMPFAAELHFRLWDPETEHIAIDGLEAFWERRTQGHIDDFRFPALDPVDKIAYASLHLLRHILRGDVCLYTRTRSRIFSRRRQRTVSSGPAGALFILIHFAPSRRSATDLPATGSSVVFPPRSKKSSIGFPSPRSAGSISSASPR